MGRRTTLLQPEQVKMAEVMPIDNTTDGISAGEKVAPQPTSSDIVIETHTMRKRS